MNVKRKYGQNAELLWKDRKRYFGLPWSFTRYSLVKNEDKWFKVFCEVGLLYTIVEEINLYRIKDITLHQTLGDKIFGTGTISLYSNDTKMPVMYLRHIAHPYKVRDYLSNQIEEQRRIAGVNVAELAY